jgi:hypothetical protein
MTFEAWIKHHQAEKEARELAAHLGTVRTAYYMRIAERIYREYMEGNKK